MFAQAYANQSAFERIIKQLLQILTEILIISPLSEGCAELDKLPWYTVVHIIMLCT